MNGINIQEYIEALKHAMIMKPMYVTEMTISTKELGITVEELRAVR